MLKKNWFLLLASLYCTTLVSSPSIEQEIQGEFEKSFKASPQQQPIILLIGGFQGSGKSSLIRRIQKIYDVNVIATDRIRQSLFNRGITDPSEVSINVNSIYQNLVRSSLLSLANTVIDANAHAKRIDTIEKLLTETNSSHIVIKILLKTSVEKLKARITARAPLSNCYQGTEDDLNTSLSKTTLFDTDYNHVIITNTQSEEDVFKAVNTIIAPLLQIAP